MKTNDVLTFALPWSEVHALVKQILCCVGEPCS